MSIIYRPYVALETMRDNKSTQQYYFTQHTCFIQIIRCVKYGTDQGVTSFDLLLHSSYIAFYLGSR